MRNLIVKLALFAALLLGFSFMGALHRAADAFAILRPALALALLMGALAARKRPLRAALGGAALLALASVAGYFLAQKPGPLRVYSKNMLGSNGQIESMYADIVAAQADIVLLQEVTDYNAPLLGLLAERFPHQHICVTDGWDGVAVASRYPMDGDPVCSELRAVTAVPFSIEGRRVWAVSAHIPWPWPAPYEGNEAAAYEALAGLEGPVVIGGDFNMVPWSFRVAEIARLTGTRMTGPLRPTRFLGGFLPVPIDYVLASEGGRMQMRPLLGSDHEGVLAEVKLWQD